jgi:hypothetical protein
VTAAGLWFSLVSSTNKTDRHDIAEILLKVALNTITIITNPYIQVQSYDQIILFIHIAYCVYSRSLYLIDWTAVSGA